MVSCDTDLNRAEKKMGKALATAKAQKKQRATEAGQSSRQPVYKDPSALTRGVLAFPIQAHI